MVDLVLVNPNNAVPAPFSAREPPLWLGLIAGYFLSLGAQVRIVDAEVEDLSHMETVDRVKMLDPKAIIIVVMGNNPSVSSTPKMPVAEALLKDLPGAKLTGLHPIAMQYPNTLIEPFEGFPKIPWHLLPMDKYWAHNWHCLADIDKRNPYGVLYTSLNCPYACTFCNVHVLYGDRKMRLRPLEDVYADLDYFAQHEIRNIKVWDELFVLYGERVARICGYIIGKGYDFNIWAYARVAGISSPLLRSMKQAGFNWLAYGFESMSQPVRLMAHKGFSLLTAVATIDKTREAGINIMGNFMFGLPGETMDAMKANLNMAIQANFEYVNFYVALPYPGSEWYDNLEVKPTDWSRFNQYSLDNYADPKVMAFKNEAFRAYFSRPEYLNMIEIKFGEKAKRHILEMLKWRIS